MVSDVFEADTNDQALTQQSQRVGLILSEIDALPTISPVAVRVLELAGSVDATVEEIVKLIESDPALSAKLLSLCRRADMGLSVQVNTVERAVVLLGLEAVRACALSVEVFEVLGGTNDEERELLAGAARTVSAGYSRSAQWRYLVAVACAAELLAERHQLSKEHKPEEAFICGLLHGIGRLALDRLLPKAFIKSAELAEARQQNLDDALREVLGIDDHTAGKRLAEHWGLPDAITDTIWLHGQNPSVLPNLPHSGLVSIVTVATALVRRQHIGWSGDHGPLPELTQLATEAHLDPTGLDETIGMLHERVADRVAVLGLDDVEDRQLLLESVFAANRKLGRLAGALERRSRTEQRHKHVLEALNDFLEDAREVSGVRPALAAVVRSAANVAGGRAFAGVIQSRPGAPWHVYYFDARGDTAGEPAVIGRKGDVLNLASACVPGGAGQALGALEPALGSFLPVQRSHIVPLAQSGKITAVLICERHPEQTLRESGNAQTLINAWGGAVVGAAHNAAARAVGEQLVESNRKLSALHNELVETRAMSRLGELASGAAHEMNNPLAVISGKAQLLLARSRTGEAKGQLSDIVESCSQLSGLVEGLHFFASPQQGDMDDLDMLKLVQEVIPRAIKQAGMFSGELDDSTSQNGMKVPEVTVSVADEARMVYADAQALGMAITELISNALEAAPGKTVDVHVHPDPTSGRLKIRVVDRGSGFSEHARRHATDPFFSEKQAGRRTGLGLSKVARVAEMHKGALSIDTSDGLNTVALAIDQWRGQERRAA